MRAPCTTLVPMFCALLIVWAACGTQRLAPIGEVPVASVTVTPPELRFTVGARMAVLAVVLDTSGNALGGRSVTWASSNPAIATVAKTGDATGEVLGVAVGTASITATSGGKSSSISVTVTQPPVVAVDTIVIAPSSASVDAGQTVQLTAVAKDASGNILTGRAITWSSSNTSIATVSSSGLVTGVSPGIAGITAASEGQQTTATITVMTPPATPVAAVDVAPATASVVAGQTVQLTATPKDAGGAPLVGRSVTWTSSNLAVATVSSTGLVTGVSVGTVTITATSEGKTGTAAVTVTAAPPVPVATVSVTPATASVIAGQTVQLAATTKDANGNTLTGRVVSWSSSNATIATVSATGLVTGISAGSVTITAMSEGKTGTAAVTVTAPPSAPVATVTVTPATASVAVGQMVQLAATLKDANGNTLTGRVVTWTSSNTAVATVSSSGLVTGLTAGSVTITATSEGKSGTASVTVTSTVTLPGTVTNLSVASVTTNAVTLSFTEVHNGAGAPASYDVRYAVSPLSWGTASSVTQGTCATPLAGTAIGATRTCTVLGLAPATNYQFQLVAFRGTINVDAAYGALSNVASGTTTASTAPVASVTVSPATASVGVGGTQQFTATLKDANGNTLTGRVLTWMSSNTAIATVSSGGLVTGVTLGTATMTATSEGHSGTATVTVSSAPPSGWPNEPGGLTLLTDNPWNVMQSSGWGLHNPGDPYQEASIVADAAAPHTPSNVLEFRYLTGHVPGQGTHKFWFFMNRNEVFLGLYFKHSANWQQTGAALTKMFYVFQRLNSSNRQSIFMALGGSTGGPLALRISNEALDGSWWTQNVSNVTLTPGRWYKLEIYLKKASFSGADDGIVRWWVDGVLAANYPAAKLRGEPFTELHIAPVWGGTCCASVSQNIHLRYDHVYISGR